MAPRKISRVKFTKIKFPDFLKAIKKDDKVKLRQAKKQRYKINVYWLIENKIKPSMVSYLLKNGMVNKSTKNLGKLIEKMKK